jgi:hypothetical protein
MDTRSTYLRKTPAMLLLGCALALVPAALRAQNVVLVIRAVNERAVPATNEVVRYLPPEVGPDDIIRHDDMELLYDTTEEAYYLKAEAVLDAGDTRDYRVVIRDVWTIPQERLDELRKHAAELAGTLGKTRRKETAAQLNAQVEEAIAAIEHRQQIYSMERSGVARHISAAEKNRELLSRAGRDIADLEHLTMGEGIDPLSLQGNTPPLPEDEEDNIAGEGVATIRLRVANPAAVERSVQVKQYFPSEVRPEDIKADDRLTVNYDVAKEACYVYAEAITIGPEDFVDFEILVTNRWAVPQSRYDELMSDITNLQVLAKMDNIPSAVTEADDLYVDLSALMENEAPKGLTDEYILFYRRQMAALDDIEARILRLAKYLKPPEERQIFDASILKRVKPPSTSTTWIIIYIILCFLGLVSLLFFLRWYGASRDVTTAE